MLLQLNEFRKLNAGLLVEGTVARDADLGLIFFGLAPSIWLFLLISVKDMVRPTCVLWSLERTG
jgi:hypothetical protein